MTLAELLERVEKATGPDRELDALIAIATKWKPLGDIQHWIHDWQHGFCIGEAEGFVYLDKAPTPDTKWRAPSYTASIDVVLALVERVLPEWTVARIGQSDDKSWSCELRQGHLTSYSDVALGGSFFNGKLTAPLSILAALLRALAAKSA